MRRTQNGGVTESHPYLQAGLATGYLCARTEDQLHAIAAASGGNVSPGELARWMGKFFLSHAETNGDGLDSGQRLPQMRGGSAKGYALSAGAPSLHVHARGKRTLSLKARKRIAAAQRERWAKHHAAQAASSEVEKQRETWRTAKRKQRSDKGGKHIPKRSQSSVNSRTQSAYWAAMTPKQRSEEMARRIRVRAANAAAKAAAAA